MGFFKKIKKFALPAIGAIIGSAVGMPQLGAALGSSVSSYTSNHKLLPALAAGAGSYAGSSIGGSLFPGTIGDQLSPGLYTSIGGSIGDALGSTTSNALLNTSLGSVFGSQYGSSIGESLAGAGNAKGPELPAAPAGPAPFVPMQQDAKDLPASLSGLGSLTQNQQSTNIANQGVYGGGAGPQEQEYFMNLLNRRLVDKSGKTSDMSGINPIEQSYLQRLGLGGYGDTSSLLEAMSKWKAA